MKKYILLVILTVILGALLLFLQYGDYLMCTDYARQEIPFIMETKRMLSSGTPWWSWNTYYGDNFLGSYSFYTLTSPFVWLLCLLPYAWIVKGCFVVLVLKYICAFLTSRLFLRKMDVSHEAACIGGLLYAFSSHAISNSFYFHFFEPLIVFPLLLVAIERFLRRERWGCTALLMASFLTAFINYYFSVGSFIAAGMYVFCRLLFSEARGEWKRVPLGVALIAVGIAMDAFVLLPTAMHIAGGPRTSGHILSGLDYTAWPFFLERLRVLFMPQVIEQPTALFSMTGFRITSVCLPVAGMLMAILYCWHNKRSWITALLALSLFVFLTPCNTVLSLFTNPDYTRWAYALCLFLTLASCKWLDKEKDALQTRHVVFYASFVTALFAVALLLGYRPGLDIGERPSIILACYVVATLTSLTALCLFARKRTLTALSQGIMVCAVVQMALFHFIRSDAYFSLVSDLTHKNLLETYITHNNVPRHEGDMHHRTAFHERFHNACMMANQPDVATFHSIQNNAVRRLISSTDTLNRPIVASMPRINRRSFYALMSVKEAIAYDDPCREFEKKDLNLTLKGRGDGYTLHNNVDYLPMGFTYDSWVEEALIDTLNARNPKPDVPLQLLANLAVPKEEEAFFARHLRHGKLLEEEQAHSPIDSIVNARRRHTASSFTGTTTGFTSEITLPREDIVFYSCPADKGFVAYVDGRETQIHPCNLGLSAVLVPAGSHTVEFRFLPRGLKEGTAVSLVALLCAAGICFRERKDAST